VYLPAAWLGFRLFNIHFHFSTIKMQNVVICIGSYAVFTLGWWQVTFCDSLIPYGRFIVLRCIPTKICFYVRELASAYQLISYGNSVCLSVCPFVVTRYCFKTSRDSDFGFSLYDSLVSLVFRDKISCHWVKGVPTNEGAKQGHPS